MADYDLLIKNGTIVDGLRMPAFKGDLGIRNGKIAAMGNVHAAALPSSGEGSPSLGTCLRVPPLRGQDARRPRAAWRRLWPCAITADRGPSMTSAVTSSPRWAGRQWK